MERMILMNYCSTRDRQVGRTAAQAILQGLSAEGGLFVPEEFPALPPLDELSRLSYTERALHVLGPFLTDFPADQLRACVRDAYAPERFGGLDNPAPLAPLSGERWLLELWHGPTCAFKDMALQLLPRLMTAAAGIAGDGREIVILTATSGDTGKAALEGFRDVPGVRLLVFYPRDGVSPMQKRQMVTQEGGNLSVCAIDGNFDHAQSAVKSIFSDPALAARLEQAGMRFSSANSINWGRLAPQIVYYVSAYCDLLAQGRIRPGQAVNVCVPTGNFGNLLAAFYAKKMGLPIGRLICASNRNRVLTDFLRTGIYDRNRDFFTTLSPSMDILISSNLERLLWDLSGGEPVKDWYGQLAAEGRFQADDSVRARLAAEFYGGFCSDEDTCAAIRDTFREEGYLCDPHTAVALKVCRDYREETGDAAPVVIASTASPHKFVNSVLSALGQPLPADEYDGLRALEALSGQAAPAPLKALEGKPVRFDSVIPREGIRDQVLRALGL